MSGQPTTLGDLAKLVGGRVEGELATMISGAAVLNEAAAGQITLVDHTDRIKRGSVTAAAAVVLPEHTAGKWRALEGGAARIPALIVTDAHAAFATIVSYFRPRRKQAAVGIHPKAIVSATARWGKGVNIHPGATVGDHCQIGDGTTILPGAHVLDGCVIGRDATIGAGVVLYEKTIIGNRVILHSGVIIGAHGFGYSQAGGRHILSAQLGYVQIDDDVEIGAGTTVDRGTYGATTIGEGTKIDNLVQIAHNCRIGRHNLICAQVGIAGSTTTGDYVVIGGQAGLRDHVHIGAGARLGAMCGITNDVPDGAVMLGIPATPEREQKLKLAALAKLPEMRKELKAMRRTIAELQSILAGPAVDAVAGIQHPASQRTDQAA
jgi:UDP-3-O-[3-hydroxymyristoyl] glucosamine N-acyltransferase